MLQYFLILAYIVIVCLLPIKNKRTSLIFCLIPLFFFVVLQNNWTPDYETYQESYLEAHENWLFSYFSMDYEFGFAILCSLMPTFRWLIAFQMGLFSIALFIVFYYYIPKRYWILCFLILWTDSNMLIMNLSAMRSCVVASLFVIAMHLRLNGKTLLPILIALPLCLFHKSGILTLPFVLMGRNISKNVLFVIYGVLFFFIVVGYINPNFLLQTVQTFFADKDDFGKYAYYTKQSFSDGASNILMKSILTSCLIFLMYMEVHLKKINKYHVDFYFMCAIFLYFLQGTGIPMVTRFSTYFGLFSLVCYTRMLQSDKTPLSRLFIWYIVLFNIYYLAFFVTRMGQWETLRVYHSIL